MYENTWLAVRHELLYKPPRPSKGKSRNLIGKRRVCWPAVVTPGTDFFLLTIPVAKDNLEAAELLSLILQI